MKYTPGIHFTKIKAAVRGAHSVEMGRAVETTRGEPARADMATITSPGLVADTPQSTPAKRRSPRASISFFRPEADARVAVPDPGSETQEAELIIALFRTLILCVALFAPRALGLPGSYETSAIWLAGLAGVYNIMTGVSCLFPSRYGLRRPFIVAMDMMLVTLWIHMSGQWDLFPFYYLVVVVAAMWFRVLGGALVAAFCNFFFLLMWFRVIGEPEVTRASLFGPTMVPNIALLFVVGCLVGCIAEAQDRERERRLESQLLVDNYEREIDISTHLQPLLIASLEKNHDPALEVGIAMKSARALGGGDYLDLITFKDGRTGLCVADVSGKSARAQARIPLLKYSLRALAPLYASPNEVLEHLNETLGPDLSTEIYIALCYIVLDPQHETLSWCNAGHIAPLFISGDCTLPSMGELTEAAFAPVVPLETNGPPLGMFPDMTYTCGTRSWQAGDQLMLYTDGLVDALSYDKTEDGEAQVRRLALRLATEAERPPRSVAQDFVDLATAALEESSPLQQRLKTYLTTFSPPGEPVPSLTAVHRDDVTVAVVRYKIF
jgi:serine phosphatase RsbU (regulator of sigma subunit)